MNPAKRFLLRATLSIIDASLANHAPVNTIGDTGPVCASCRPLQAWPCRHYADLTAKRQPIEEQVSGVSNRP